METVAEVLNDTTAKIQKSFDALKAQFAGLRTGKATVYHENGQLYMEGMYKEGRHTGTWTYYDEQGYPIRTDDYGE